MPGKFNRREGGERRAGEPSQPSPAPWRDAPHLWDTARAFPRESEYMVEIGVLEGHVWLVCRGEPFSPGGCSMCADLLLCGPTFKCDTEMLLRDAPASPGVETAEEQVDSGWFCPKNTFHRKRPSDTWIHV